MELKSLIREAYQIVEDLYGLSLQDSTFSLLDSNEWRSFSRNQRLEPGTRGVYFPRTKRAFLQKDSPYLALDILHELFGHGIFLEHSESGVHISHLEQQMGSLESKLREEPNDDREETVKSLGELYDRTNAVVGDSYAVSEGFALWLEHDFGN
jgi:hypothetical protein